jgi:osmoprotectant transport system permease protein
MFGLMIPILGIGLVPAVTAIVLYSLLPVVQNVYTGITTVRPDVRDAAIGLGMSGRQILFRVELPLALLVLFAGIRTAVVNAIGMATLASLIGAGGLGDLIFRGISTVSLTVVLAGSVPLIVLAVLGDVIIKRIEDHLANAIGQEQRA